MADTLATADAARDALELQLAMSTLRTVSRTIYARISIMHRAALGTTMPSWTCGGHDAIDEKMTDRYSA